MAKRARYPERIDEIRREEYPMLDGITFLDHAATTPAPASLLSAFAQDLTKNLYGNPHSGSTSSQLSTTRIEDIRLRVLQYFKADPDVFDLVFVANATAGAKLVADVFRDAGLENGGGFSYVYHNDVHTSLVGIREMADAGSLCIQRSDEVETWLDGIRQRTEHWKVNSAEPVQLFAYPAQSNMNGYRPDPQRAWCKRVRTVREQTSTRLYTLYDAAGFVSTSSLDLSDVASAPDFTVLSFYKIFGFPDMGALILRKDSGEILRQRRYFGGGTVDMVISGGQPWHFKKSSSCHDMLEDGTLPFHNIVALGLAMDVHRRIYENMDDVALHTAELSQVMIRKLESLKHGNGATVCQLYRAEDPRDGSYGPVIAFNLKNSNGLWVGKSEVERLASVKSIELRTGTLCNPGGTASHLGLSSDEMRTNFAMGQRCGDENDLMDGKPTGLLRISFGAMSSMQDVETFVSFVGEYFVDRTTRLPMKLSLQLPQLSSRYYIESLCVFPIKSCGGFKIPPDVKWEVHPEGLAWDREWCLVHQGTGSVLTQKRYPRMAILRPEIDLKSDSLRIKHSASNTSASVLDIPLSRTSASSISTLETRNICTRPSSSKVCGDKVQLEVYTSPRISNFFTEAVAVPCTLARFRPRAFVHPSVPPRTMKFRHPRTHLSAASTQIAGPSPSSSLNQNILLSNESPILLISRSSISRLNQQIKWFKNSSRNKSSSDNGVDSTVIPASAFRANIVVTQTPPQQPGLEKHSAEVIETPYAEDTWREITISPRTSTLSSDLSPSSPISSSSTSPASSILSSSTATTMNMTPTSTMSENQSKGTAKHGSSQSRTHFRILGPCKRCQMICVDQQSGQRRHTPGEATLTATNKDNGSGHAAGLSSGGGGISLCDEPFSTLAKTRRWGGGVWFGVHVGFCPDENDCREEVTEEDMQQGAEADTDADADGDDDGDMDVDIAMDTDDQSPAFDIMPRRRGTAIGNRKGKGRRGGTRRTVWLAVGDEVIPQVQ